MASLTLANFAYLDRGMVQQLTHTDETVMICGPSGTGKSVLARLVHEASLRKNGPCQTISMATLNSSLADSELFGHVKGAFTGAIGCRNGILKSCDTGTLILDDIDTASTTLQAALLQFMEDRIVRRVGDNAFQPVDVRVISTTNVDLEAKCQAGCFRYDLYHRLTQGLSCHLPPLSDVPRTYIANTIRQLIKEKREQYPDIQSPDKKVCISDQTIERLMTSCAGNYRTVYSFALYCALSGRNRFTIGDIEQSMQGNRRREPITDQIIAQTVQQCGGNKSAASRILGITEGTIRRRLKRISSQAT